MCRAVHTLKLTYFNGGLAEIYVRWTRGPLLRDIGARSVRLDDIAEPGASLRYGVTRDEVAAAALLPIYEARLLQSQSFATLFVAIRRGSCSCRSAPGSVSCVC